VTSKYADFRSRSARQVATRHFYIPKSRKKTFAEGMMFDGSSFAGWKAINESDMCLMPDPSSACIDPFFAETHAGAGFATWLERPPASPITAIARYRQEGEGMVKSMGVGDTIYFRTRSRFFVFDDVRLQRDTL